MTRNYSVFGVAFLVTVVAALSPFFSNKPALAGCGWGDITCSPDKWTCPPGGCGGGGNVDSGSETQGQDPPRPKPPTILKFCNNTTSKLYVAYVKNTGNQGWLSDGWFSVSPKNCRPPLNIGVYQGDIYLYAIDGQGGFYGKGDASFCVDNANNFNFSNANTRNCNGGNLKKVGTSRWKVGSGTNTYTYK
jgi:uncharacterized membrane protein